MVDILQKNYEDMEENAKNDKFRGWALNMLSNYPPHWGIVDGSRELAQNFFDRIVEQRRMVSPQFNINEVKYEKAASGLFEFYAYPENENRILLGSIEITEEAGVSEIAFTNEYTILSTKILAMGATNKRKSDALSGGFGEGMKVGINAILRHPGARVWYTTNGYTWEFKHEKKSNGSVVLRVNFSAQKSATKSTATFVHIQCNLGTQLLERMLRRNFLFMQPVFQGAFDAFTLSGNSPGCWTELHFFFHPSLQVTKATMAPELSGEAERPLTGALLCRGITVTYDANFYYGIGINLGNKDLMTRDRNIIDGNHAYDAVSKHLATFLRRHSSQAGLLKYLFDLLQSLPRIDSGRMLCFGDQLHEANDGFHTVWSALHTGDVTGDNQWLATQLLREFNARFKEGCFPCIDATEKAKFKELGIGEGVVVSEVLFKFLRKARVVRSIEQHLEDTLLRAPVLEVSRDPRVVLFCNQLVWVSLSGPENLDYLRTDSTTVIVRFVDRPLAESKAVFTMERVLCKTIPVILLGNKIEILPIVEDIARASQNGERDARSSVQDRHVLKLTMIAQSIRKAVTEKNSRIVNMPVSKREGQDSNMLSTLIYMMMLRDIERGRLRETAFYINRIESDDVPSVAAEAPPPPTPQPPPPPPQPLVLSEESDDHDEGDAHNGVVANGTFELVGAFDVDGQEFRIIRANKRPRIDTEPH